MSCRFDQRHRLLRKMASVVPNGTAGAFSVISDNVKIVVPSPKLQCQLSVLCVPDVPVRGVVGNFAFKTSAGNCLWWIVPLLPISDVSRASDFTIQSSQVIGRSDSIIGGGTPNYSPLGGDVTLTEIAGPQSFVLSDPNPVWNAFVSLQVALTAGGVPSGYVAMFADYTPAPGYPAMSEEEWHYWVGRCELQPALGSEKLTLQVI